MKSGCGRSVGSDEVRECRWTTLRLVAIKTSVVALTWRSPYVVDRAPMHRSLHCEEIVRVQTCPLTTPSGEHKSPLDRSTFWSRH